MFWYFAKWLYECIIQVLKRLKDSISAFSIYWDAFWYFSRRCNNICIAIFALQHLLQVVATDLKWTLFFKLFSIIHTTSKQMLLNSFYTNFSNNNFQFVSNTSFVCFTNLWERAVGENHFHIIFEAKHSPQNNNILRK